MRMVVTSYLQATIKHCWMKKLYGQVGLRGEQQKLGGTKVKIEGDKKAKGPFKKN